MTIRPGAIRFNTDSMKLEIFRGSANYNGSASMTGIGTLAAGQWEEIVATSPDVLTGGARGLFTGGYGSGASSPKVTNKINYVNIASTGNAQEFGTLSLATLLLLETLVYLTIEQMGCQMIPVVLLVVTAPPLEIS